MLKRKLVLMIYLTPMMALSLSLSAGYIRADENPPIIVQERREISSMSVEETVIIPPVATIPHATIHQENVELPEQDNKFIPIGKYYDELKHGDMKFDGKLQEYLWLICERYHADFYLIMAQICEESEYDPDAEGYNDNGTIDMGLAQINSRYLDYFSSLVYGEIDPYNPYDAMDWLVWFYCNEKQYWTDRGLSGDQLDMAILGSYNKGRDSMRSYIREYGYQYYYNDNIIHRRQQLIREHSKDI
jgi:hypothetical protein